MFAAWEGSFDWHRNITFWKAASLHYVVTLEKKEILEVLGVVNKLSLILNFFLSSCLVRLECFLSFSSFYSFGCVNKK